MAKEQGTLRLVSGGDSVGVGEPMGLGSAADDAWNGVKTALKTIGVNVAQQQQNYPTAQVYKDLSAQLTALATALDAYYVAVNAPAPAPPIMAPTAPAGATVPAQSLQTAQQIINTLTGQIQQLGNVLKGLGYTVNSSPSGLAITAPSTAPGARTAAPGGGYSVGQTAAVGVAGAIAGWLGNDFWREYRAKGRL